jgi:23S rRNA A2030 N6-methylase RlmJ
VVKHPALIAALDTILPDLSQTSRHFHYFDAFAGHAWHPLLDEGIIAGVQKDFEWVNGIGFLLKELWRVDGSTLNRHLKIWRDWYIPQRKSLVNGWYPGSSIIAADMCRNNGREIQLTLFDISQGARSDLKRFFCPIAPTETTRDNVCVIHRAFNPTQFKIGAIRTPGFVFIDPPGWRSKEHPLYPRWQEILAHVLAPRSTKHVDGERPTLMWMPAGGQETAYPWNLDSRGPQRRKCDSLREHGYSWTSVRWNDNSYDGCILAYNCARPAIRMAIDSIVRMAGRGWKKRHSE